MNGRKGKHVSTPYSGVRDLRLRTSALVSFACIKILEKGSFCVRCCSYIVAKNTNQTNERYYCIPSSVVELRGELLLHDFDSVHNIGSSILPRARNQT